jgi:hypothetical protein
VATNHGGHAEENTHPMRRMPRTTPQGKTSELETKEDIEVESRMMRKYQVRFGGGVTFFPTTGSRSLPYRFQFVANVQTYDPRHYVHVGLLADWKSGTPEVLEPQASGAWEWYHLDNFPQPLFEMSRLAVESCKTGRNYYDL